MAISVRLTVALAASAVVTFLSAATLLLLWWRFCCRSTGGSKQSRLVGAVPVVVDDGEQWRHAGVNVIGGGGHSQLEKKRNRSSSNSNSGRVAQRWRLRRRKWRWWWWWLGERRRRKLGEIGGGGGCLRNKKKKQAFVWRENPSLIEQAVEVGWSAFAMVQYRNRSSRRRKPVATIAAAAADLEEKEDYCVSLRRHRRHGKHHHLGDEIHLDYKRYKYAYEEDEAPKIWWEMQQLQPDEVGGGGKYHSSTSVVMQKICLNPRMANNEEELEEEVGSVQAMRSALPLPGPPPLFPSQAYFEVTILRQQGRRRLMQKPHDEKQKQLLHPSSSTTTRRDFSSILMVCGKTDAAVDDRGHASLQQQQTTTKKKKNKKILGIGLVSDVDVDEEEDGRRRELVPGVAFGSVGWHSDGRIYVNGAQQNVGVDVEDDIENGVMPIPMVVGCGFDPATRTAFFTLDGNVIYRMTGLGRPFGFPLYPAVAANYGLTFLINFGQIPFAYLPANVEDESNPAVYQRASAQLREEEMSGDLFSLPRRMDSLRWHLDPQYLQSEDGESDRFDIVLD